jgi:hypothetical protein
MAEPRIDDIILRKAELIVCIEYVCNGRAGVMQAQCGTAMVMSRVGFVREPRQLLSLRYPDDIYTRVGPTGTAT